MQPRLKMLQGSNAGNLLHRVASIVALDGHARTEIRSGPGLEKVRRTYLRSCQVAWRRGPLLLAGLGLVGTLRGRRRAASAVQLGGIKGTDARRLLDSIRGKKRVVPAKNIDPKQAALALLEKRAQELEESSSPYLPRRAERLPLVIKYHKPKGLETNMNNATYRALVDDSEPRDVPEQRQYFITQSGKRKRRKGKKRRIRVPAPPNLRTVMVQAADRFELGLYHPMGDLATDNSGLLLWSRNRSLTEHLLDPSRGVVLEYELDVYGVVDEEQLRQKMRAGIPLGYIGFQIVRYADVREAAFMPTSSLQDVHSRVVVATRDPLINMRELMKACGVEVAEERRIGIGPISLDGLEEEDLAAATEEEERWLCDFADLPADEYPLGYLPEGEGSPLALPSPYTYATDDPYSHLSEKIAETLRSRGEERVPEI